MSSTNLGLVMSAGSLFTANSGCSLSTGTGSVNLSAGLNITSGFTFPITISSATVSIGPVSGITGSRLSINPSGVALITTGTLSAALALTLGGVGGTVVSWTPAVGFANSLTLGAGVYNVNAALIGLPSLQMLGGTILRTTNVPLSVVSSFAATGSCALDTGSANINLSSSGIALTSGAVLSLQTTTGSVFTGAVSGAGSVIIRPTGAITATTGVFSGGASLTLRNGSITWTPVATFSAPLTLSSAVTFTVALSGLGAVNCSDGSLSSNNLGFVTAAPFRVLGPCAVNTGSASFQFQSTLINAASTLTLTGGTVMVGTITSSAPGTVAVVASGLVSFFCGSSSGPAFLSFSGSGFVDWIATSSFNLPVTIQTVTVALGIALVNMGALTLNGGTLLTSNLPVTSTNALASSGFSTISTGFVH
jgi:hypothetical protein